MSDNFLTGKNLIPVRIWLFKQDESKLLKYCRDNIPYSNRLLKDIIGKPDIYAVNNVKIAEFGLVGINNIISNKYEVQIDTVLNLYCLFLFLIK